MPHFVTQRDLYEVRERPSKTYSWKVFILSNIIVEIPWNTLMAIIMFFCVRSHTPENFTITDYDIVVLPNRTVPQR